MVWYEAVNDIVFHLDGFLEQKINLSGKQNIEKKNIENKFEKQLCVIKQIILYVNNGLFNMVKPIYIT